MEKDDQNHMRLKAFLLPKASLIAILNWRHWKDGQTIILPGSFLGLPADTKVMELHYSFTYRDPIVIVHSTKFPVIEPAEALVVEGLLDVSESVVVRRTGTDPYEITLPPIEEPNKIASGPI